VQRKKKRLLLKPQLLKPLHQLQLQKLLQHLLLTLLRLLLLQKPLLQHLLLTLLHLLLLQHQKLHLSNLLLSEKGELMLSFFIVLFLSQSIKYQ
jgi:hypothetical protein